MALGITFFLYSAARAGVIVGDVEANVLPLPSRDSRSGYAEGTNHGYVELRVQLKNNSTEERTVHLSYPPDPRRLEGGVLVYRTVRVAGKQAVSVSLYQPSFPVENEALEVRVEGVREGKLIPASSTHDASYGSYSSSGINKAAVLLSRGVPQEFRDGMRKEPAAAASAAPAGGPGGPVGIGTAPASATVTGLAELERFTFLRSELPVSQWSPNWLGYSCYDVIVLSGEEAEQLPTQAQLAIRRWVECGGSLLIHAKTAPEVFTQGGRPENNWSYSVGLGHVAACLADHARGWEATYSKLTGMRMHVYQPESVPGNLFDLLVAETTVPVRGLFVLVLLFGIGIGPANWWLLSRYKRRIWLWWNVPAVSLLTCLLVFGYSLASEGWTGRGKTASLTFLDQQRHRATSIGYLSFYCPLTPSSGPRFDPDTDVATLNSGQTSYGRYHSRESETLRLVDWTNDQHLVSGWVSARVPTYFQIRKNEDRRERLSVETQADGSLKIVNALGADMRRLCLADSSGRIFEADNLPAGAERTLKAAEGKSASYGKGLLPRELFIGGGWLQAFHGLIESKTLSASLSPGGYIAILERSPFVETPLANADTADSAAIVYGIY